MKRIKNAWNDANGWIKAIKLISGISFSAIFLYIFALFLLYFVIWIIASSCNSET